MIPWVCLLPVNGEVVYLSLKHNDSVELVCSSSGGDPYAFYLKRKWLQPKKEVLFVLKGEKPTFGPDETGRSRIRVVEGLGIGQVNVSISHLQGSDTDRYVCEFVYENLPSDYTKFGREEFFLYIADYGKMI